MFGLFFDVGGLLAFLSAPPHLGMTTSMSVSSWSLAPVLLYPITS